MRRERYGPVPKTGSDSDSRLVATFRTAGSTRRGQPGTTMTGIEARVTEIAIEIALAAEIQHREGAVRHHQWLIEEKARLEEEERRRRAEAERAEQERQRRLEHARIDRLLAAAKALEQAAAIRRYVDAIRAARPGGVSDEEIENWSAWALAQADRIDPTQGGAFLSASRDEEC